MRSDLLFFLGVFAFIFIAWVATGGPNRPIDFAGPYITPLTNVNTVQEGYGTTTTHFWSGVTGGSYSYTGQTISATKTPAQVQSELASDQAQLADLQTKINQTRLFGDPSPYHGEITIGGGNIYATDPDQQYVTIQLSSSATADVTISGWKVTSLATDKSATIPYGDPLPASASASARSPIVLRPGDQAIISTGESPVDASFRENECTGYFAGSRTFSPYLSSTCPSPQQEYDRFYSGNQYKDQACYDLMRSAQSCRTPKESGNLSSTCYDLIDNYLTYAGCVAHHQGDAYFLGTTWHIYLDYHYPFSDHRTSKDLLWRSTHEAVKLMDSNGKTVDLYTTY